MPAPVFVNDPVPVIVPAYVPALACSKVTAARLMMSPWRLAVVPISRPPDTIVPPEYVLTPVRIRVPLPVLASVPDPPMLPPNTALWPLWVVRVADPSAIRPVPASAPIDWS